MKMRILAAVLAAFFMFPLFGTVAYASGGDYPNEVMPPIVEKQPVPTEAPPPEPTPNPFTPSGTGTVINYASDEDGKLFYTIMTPDEHVFYLVIDRQRGAENVYFLNAVTIADLAALAEIPAPPQGGTVTPTPTPPPTEAPAETPPPAAQEQSGGNMGMMIVIAVIVVIGGGAGWYFKIYRPKQQGAASGDEYEPPADEADYSDDWDDEQGETDDGPPWDEDESGDDE